MTATLSVNCWQCRTDAVHRYQHRRDDRRRAQWRAAKARKSARAGATASLHALKCKGPRYCTCHPIMLRGAIHANAG